MKLKALTEEKLNGGRREIRKVCQENMASNFPKFMKTIDSSKLRESQTQRYDKNYTNVRNNQVVQ